MKSRFTILTLIALLCVSTSIQTVAAGPDDGNQVISVYETIKDAAEARRDELLYLLEEDISLQVMDGLRSALDSMKLAEETSQSDPGASLGHYMDALRLFRETWTLYLEENKEGASSSFSPLEEPEIIEIPQDLEKEIKETKEKLLVKFQEKIVKQYTKIVDDVEEIKDFVPGEDNKKIQSAVNKVQKKIEDLSKKISKGDLDEVIDTLEDEPEPFDEDFDDLSDKEAKETLKTIARIGHEEYKTEEKLNKKVHTGEDASDEEEELQKLGEKIDDIKNKFKEKVARFNNRRKTRPIVPDRVEKTEEPEVFPNFTEDETKVEDEDEDEDEKEVEEEEEEEVEVEDEDEDEDEKEVEEDEEEEVEVEDETKEEEKEEDDLEKEEDKLDKEEEKEEDEDEDN